MENFRCAKTAIVGGLVDGWKNDVTEIKPLKEVNNRGQQQCRKCTTPTPIALLIGILVAKVTRNQPTHSKNNVSHRTK